MPNFPNDLYTYVAPRGAKRLPILVSVPHSGLLIPPAERSIYIDTVISPPQDTDWYVNELYGFAPDLGIGLLVANYSRYVVDLNRDPKGIKLYNDQRQETAVIPQTTFAGQVIYRSPLSEELRQQRLTYYFDPYHQKIKTELANLKTNFKHVLLYDAHSIERVVSTIQAAPFQDLILGNQSGKTCDPTIFAAAAQTIKASQQYSLSENNPFKGGYITRNFADPAQNIHTLQLEMSQDIYMDEGTKKKKDPDWQNLQATLKKVLQNLGAAVAKLA